MRPLESQSYLPAIVLAAGQSARMGTPKQLLPYKGTHLLGHAIQSASEAGFAPVHVVLGCFAELIEPALAPFRVRIVTNHEWREGMASSIRCGLASAIAIDPECQGILLMLCDQPLLDFSHLRRLRAAWQHHPMAVASRYGDALGAPALFRRDLFPELQGLSGSAGARDILHRQSAQVVAIEAAEAAGDIDTPEDYANLRSQNCPAPGDFVPAAIKSSSLLK